MNPYVTRVQALEDYHLVLTFDNGETRVFDAKPYLKRGVFAKLEKTSVFEQARVVAGSVEWPANLDLSYDTLYLESQPCKV